MCLSVCLSVCLSISLICKILGDCCSLHTCANLRCALFIFSPDLSIRYTHLVLFSAANHNFTSMHDTTFCGFTATVIVGIPHSSHVPSISTSIKTGRREQLHRRDAINVHMNVDIGLEVLSVSNCGLVTVQPCASRTRVLQSNTIDTTRTYLFSYSDATRGQHQIARRGYAYDDCDETTSTQHKTTR